ncbi:MAG: pitrilysin family protein [Pseudomonadota bacterium]|nr:pitrilysin family protein [Pseudomonadota bacterium]
MPQIPHFLFSLLVAVFCSLAANFVHALVPTAEYQLDNGLQVVLVKDDRAPVVHCHVWFPVGSSDEPDGLTGLSHVLEHMMFQGTPRFPDSAYSDTINGSGGSFNAATSADETFYYAVIPPETLEQCLALEADRMRNLEFATDDFKREVEVVKEERRMRIDDRPLAKANEVFEAQLFNGSGYGHPIIGWERDLDRLSPADVYGWYQTWYAPSKATLMVAGDFDLEQTQLWIKQYFASLSDQTQPRKFDQASGQPLTIKPRALSYPKINVAQQTVDVGSDIDVLMKGFLTPSWFTAADEQQRNDVAALTLLSAVLSSGQNSQLVRSMVYELELASSVTSSYAGFRKGYSAFRFFVVPNSGVTLEQLRIQLDQEIAQVQDKTVEPEVLDRIRRQFVAAQVYEQDALAAQVRGLADLLNSGLPVDFDQQWLARLERVTPEDIQRVAKQYLQPEHSAMLFVQTPSSEDEQTTPASSGGQ